MSLAVVVCRHLGSGWLILPFFCLQNYEDLAGKAPLAIIVLIADLTFSIPETSLQFSFLSDVLTDPGAIYSEREYTNKVRYYLKDTKLVKAVFQFELLLSDFCASD